jgi:hypothetical protein
MLPMPPILRVSKSVWKSMSKSAVLLPERFAVPLNVGIQK